MGISANGQRRAGRHPSDRGATLVEFALLMPFLMLLVFGVIDFGWTLSQNMDMRAATNFGARAASVNAGEGASPDARLADLISQVQDRSSQLETSSVEVAVQVENTNGNAIVGDVGDDVVVCVRYPFESLTGMLSPVINGYAETVAVMRIEQDANFSSGSSTTPAWSGAACTSA